MQEVVDDVHTGADNTGSFGRIEDSLIRSAKDSQYPLHYAWERSGVFEKGYRESDHYDADKTARFAIVVRASEYTFSELESLWKNVVKEAKDVNSQLDPVDFNDFDADFGGTRVRIALYEMAINTNLNVNP